MRRYEACTYFDWTTRFRECLKSGLSFGLDRPSSGSIMRRGLSSKHGACSQMLYWTKPCELHYEDRDGRDVLEDLEP